MHMSFFDMKESNTKLKCCFFSAVDSIICLRKHKFDSIAQSTTATANNVISL